MGDPGPWAVLAFSTTSFMLGLFNAGFADAAATALVIPMAFIFGGIVQLVVAVLEVLRRNEFGAVVFGTFGPFWMIYGAIENSYGAKVAAKGGASALNGGLVIFLAMFTVLAVFFTIAALRTDRVLVAVLALVVVALVLLMLGVGGGNAGMVQASGYVTLLFAVLGWYHGAGGVIAGTFGRRVLPVGSLARA